MCFDATTLLLIGSVVMGFVLGMAAAYRTLKQKARLSML
jgi:hypothetical protein